MGAIFYLVALSTSVLAPLLPVQLGNWSPPAHSEARPWTPPAPGLLESFLKNTKHANIVKQNLGSLNGPNGASAKFMAVVASNPSAPDRKVKGIEVELKDRKHDLFAYLDDDQDPDRHINSLEEFQVALSRLADKNRIPKHVPISQPGSFGSITVTGGFNRPAASPGWCCPRYPALSAGWYRQGEVVGVIIEPANALASFEFPNANLGQVVTIIQKGREFLAAH